MKNFRQMSILFVIIKTVTHKKAFWDIKAEVIDADIYFSSFRLIDE